MTESFTDEGIILRVEERGVADKYVTCFTKKHGRVRFVAFGAKYQKSASGRILQVLTKVNVELVPGKIVDKLINVELAELPQKLDFTQLAYAAVLAEVTDLFTVDHQSDEDVYENLLAALALLPKKLPRVVILAYCVKLLQNTGFNPRLKECCQCNRALAENEELFFSLKHGGVLCKDCREDGNFPFSAEIAMYYEKFLNMNLRKPQPLEIKGLQLMQLEKIVSEFILFQVDKPLKSLRYLSQLGL